MNNRPRSPQGPSECRAGPDGRTSRDRPGAPHARRALRASAVPVGHAAQPALEQRSPCDGPPVETCRRSAIHSRYCTRRGLHPLRRGSLGQPAESIHRQLDFRRPDPRRADRPALAGGDVPLGGHAVPSAILRRIGVVEVRDAQSAPFRVPRLARLPTPRVFRRLQPRLRRADRRQTVLTPPQLRRQLVATNLRAQAHVLRNVGRVRRPQQRVDLAGQAPFLRLHPTVAHRLALARIRPHLRPVHGQLPEPDQTYSRARASTSTNSCLKSAKCRRRNSQTVQCCGNGPPPAPGTQRPLPASSQSPATKTPPSHKRTAEPCSQSRTSGGISSDCSGA